MAEALRKQYVDMNAPLLAPENLLPDAYASTSKGGKKVQVLSYVQIGQRGRWYSAVASACCAVGGCGGMYLTGVLLYLSSVLHMVVPTRTRRRKENPKVSLYL